MITRRLKMILLVTLLLLLPAASTQAVVYRGGEAISVTSEEKIKGPLFIAGKVVEINGDVDGDVFAAGEQVNLKGSVSGDVFAAAQEINITGQISGDARLAARAVYFSGKTGSSMSIAAQSVNFLEQSSLGKDLMLAAERAFLFGTIGRQLLGTMDTAVISGSVGDDVNLSGVNTLEIKDTARLKGNLIYTSPVRGQVAPGAVVNGQEFWTQKTVAAPEKKKPDYVFPFLLFIGGLALWGAGYLLHRDTWDFLGQAVTEKTGLTMLTGLLILIAAPVAGILLMITVIGLPVGFLLLAGYAIILYLSKIIVADSLGKAAGRRFGWQVHPFWPFLLAFVLIALLVRVPYIGFIFTLAVFCAGLGGTAALLTNWRRAA
ncbi:MAG: hypothetical protein C4589_09560 [Peptococcaceae bacterium]|nr:MAG: hypothetical protein C4589_09560 [Peptococcaceae bacterium]